MTLRASLLLSTILCALPLAAGCSDDSPSGMSGVPGGQAERFTCTAQLSPATFDYEVDGNSLIISNPTGVQEASRVGSGTGVQGSWLLDEADNNGFHVTLTMRIEATRVSAIARCTKSGRSGSATATSTATVTSTSIAIHQGDSVVTTF
jgi:hypothetical protein